MSKKLFILFGDNLNYNIEEEEDLIYMMSEDKQMASTFRYHNLKLQLVFGAMREFNRVMQHKLDLRYFMLDKEPRGLQARITQIVNQDDIFELVSYQPKSLNLSRKLKTIALALDLPITFRENPNYLTPRDKMQDYLKGRKRLLLNDFYKWQRKRMNILLEEDGSPVGGEWNYDKENRKKLPKKVTIPQLPSVSHPQEQEEVEKLVQKHFPNAYGSGELWLPITREASLEWLERFLETRFEQFGPYEDAFISTNNFLFHSVISPLLNIGLLNPQEVINKSLALAERNDIHLPSVEGFIRQIIGWREFLFGLYQFQPMKGNFFNHQNRLSDVWYQGETGIPPVDDTIKFVLKYGYTHHIPRLMIMLNIMMLCEIHPDDVYQWFMELFVDAYEWVMIPNVYGMGFHDGGSFATKPYVSSSNYIRKMSDYGKGEWSEIWDSLYWRFINKHRHVFEQNNRVSFQTQHLDKMDPEVLEKHREVAENFIKQVTNKS